MRPAVAAMVLACAAGCRTDARPGAGEGGVRGRVVLVVRVAGSPLPAALELIGRGACVRDTVTRSTLAFLDDGTFEHTIWRGSAVGERRSASVHRTSYEASADGAVALWGKGGEGRLRSDTLVLRILSRLACRPYEWTAVAQAAAR